MNEDELNGANLKIYPAVDVIKLSVYLAETIKSYLELGNSRFNAVGFKNVNGPLFLIREGTAEEPYIEGESSEEEYDASDDRPIYTRAKIYFRDDITQVSPPYIKITSVIADAEYEDYDPFQYISNWTIVFEIIVGESSGTVTGGESAESSDLILTGALTKLLSNREGMEECGIRNYSIKTASPSQLILETKNGITLTGEVYSEKFPGAIFSEE